ncbi:THUMP domain-containing class I SAM-dependent RNA methyltransferase [Sedimentisphaera salicampi]|uniref:THUMP domain-containing class I SAM-dependent RNA methyltransferase n=1 Tax=Sedimentisphaera salicampi TaxID=1941349 RepID=UPI000B9C0AAF|nr:hypothetical protein [Sedimentisphaera salicampi]
MNLKNKHRIMITFARELSPWVKLELEQLGYKVLEERKSGVEIEGNIEDAMLLNLKLRCAYCVMMLLSEFDCDDESKFYKEVRKIWWERIIPPEEYLSVNSRADDKVVNNTMFVNQLAKDAIVDRIKTKTGRRPDSGPEKGGVVVNIYWYNGKCYVYLNTTGRKLSDRGYRKIPYKAPVQESLAAAVLYASGYDGSQELILPMCGSGTFAIEAALIAQGRAPGLLRSNYSFMHFNKFDSELWQQMRKEERKNAEKKNKPNIKASDIDPEAVKAAEKNAKTAGADQLIDFSVCDFAKKTPESDGAIILMNPEYGMRMGEKSKLESVYKRIGDYLKQSCPGCTGCIFTGNLELAKKIGLRTSRRIVFYNADVECRLLKYELFSGSMHEREKAKLNAGQEEK